MFGCGGETELRTFLPLWNFGLSDKLDKAFAGIGL